jgi:hypothetical protein
MLWILSFSSGLTFSEFSCIRTTNIVTRYHFSSDGNGLPPVLGCFGLYFVSVYYNYKVYKPLTDIFCSYDHISHYNECNIIKSLCSIVLYFHCVHISKMLQKMKLLPMSCLLLFDFNGHIFSCCNKNPKQQGKFSVEVETKPRQQ